MLETLPFIGSFLLKMHALNCPVFIHHFPCLSLLAVNPGALLVIVLTDIARATDCHLLLFRAGKWSITAMWDVF